jgi:WhiB family transcriptional regulator, redox-sensing transcriptional regulator
VTGRVVAAAAETARPAELDTYQADRPCQCRDRDPDDWYPEGRLTSDDQHAQELCRGCPLQIKCLRFALQIGEPYGVWGGVSEGTRDAALRQKTEKDRRSAIALLLHGAAERQPSHRPTPTAIAS